MPTLSFLLYLLAVVGAWYFKLSYLGWFGPYFLASVICIPPFLVLLSLPSMLDIQLRIKTQPYVTKGKEAQLKLSFISRKTLPICRVNLTLEIENRFAGEVFKERHSFRCLGKDTVSIPLHTELCGQLSCRVTRFESRDVLGLIAIRRTFPDRVKCTVMPIPAAPDTPLDIDAALDTLVSLKPKYGGGYSEEHDLREYRPGDTVNSIHWKLSSKTDEVIVREPLVQENNEVYLVLSRVGLEDRGLEVLYWLSLELDQREISHIIVSNDLYPSGNESETAEALSGTLSSPIGEPRRFDASRARCVFRISSGEVHTR